MTWKEVRRIAEQLGLSCKQVYTILLEHSMASGSANTPTNDTNDAIALDHVYTILTMRTKLSRNRIDELCQMMKGLAQQHH